jgi:quercetin dioxygenase-like cupin family protein
MALLKTTNVRMSIFYHQTLFCVLHLCLKYIVMKRKDFLLTTLAATPLLAFSRIDAGDQGAKQPFTVKAGKGRFDETILFKGIHPNDTKISGKDTGGQLAVFEYTGTEKTGPSLHLHYQQDEVFYVVEGDYRFVVGEETHTLKAGDTIFLPRNIPHSWIQLSEKGKLIYLVQPAGKLEDFFRFMNTLTKRLPEKEMEQVHKKHGMKVVGPPLSL